VVTHVVQDEQKVSGLKWNDGEVMLYNKRAESSGMCMSITIGGVRVEAPIDYESFGYNQPIHLLICMDRLHLKGLVNGILLFDKYIPDPSYLITDFKMGNFLENGEDSIVEYDELCIVNENLFSRDFRVPTKPFHAIYPEVIIEDDNPKYHIGVATNSLIRVKESNQDKLGTLDIVRHVDYEPPQGYQTDRKRKYEYQHLGLEDNVASYKN